MAIHLEPYEGRDITMLREDLIWFMGRFNASPALQRVQGRPVFYGGRKREEWPLPAFGVSQWNGGGQRWYRRGRAAVPPPSGGVCSRMYAAPAKGPTVHPSLLVCIACAGAAPAVPAVQVVEVCYLWIRGGS